MFILREDQSHLIFICFRGVGMPPTRLHIDSFPYEDLRVFSRQNSQDALLDDGRGQIYQSLGSDNQLKESETKSEWEWWWYCYPFPSQHSYGTSPFFRGKWVNHLCRLKPFPIQRDFFTRASSLKEVCRTWKGRNLELQFQNISEGVGLDHRGWLDI